MCVEIKWTQNYLIFIETNINSALVSDYPLHYTATMSTSHMPSSPKSPQVSRLRKAMYKKSPVRSPLREVLKSRCQERMRVNRDKVVSGMRDIKMEGRELVENTIREMVRVC